MAIRALGLDPVPLYADIQAVSLAGGAPLHTIAPMVRNGARRAARGYYVECGASSSSSAAGGDAHLGVEGLEAANVSGHTELLRVHATMLS